MGKTSYASKKKYEDKTYDRVALLVPKGMKSFYQEHAKTQGESLSGFIKRAVNNQIENDNKTASI